VLPRSDHGTSIEVYTREKDPEIYKVVETDSHPAGRLFYGSLFTSDGIKLAIFFQTSK
jgi:hypothetical protein